MSSPAIECEPKAPADAAANAPTAAWWSVPVAVIVSWLLGIFAFAIFTQHNDFPTDFYHPDEPGKAQQLRGMRWNYNHPLLLLQTAAFAKSVLNVPSDERSLTILGRDVSAFMGAVAVFSAALVGYSVGGFLGLLLCGSVLALCPSLLIYAHYFKEDPSLVAGLMLALLGTRLTLQAIALQKPDPTQSNPPKAKPQFLFAVIVLGIGCAAAMSGKFIGVIALIPAIVVLRSIPVELRPLRKFGGRAFVASMLAAWAVINHRAILDIGQSLGGFGGEVGHALEGHFGLGLYVPNFFTIRVGLRETMPHVWIMLGIGVLLLVIQKRRPGRWAIAATMFPVVYALFLAFNRIPIPRYALPMTVSFYLLPALLLSHAIKPMQARFRIPLGLAAIAAVVYFQQDRCRYFLDQFRNDYRQHAYMFIATQTPPSARVIEDAFVGLHGNGDPWRFPDQPRLRQDIDYQMFAINEGNPLTLARKGYSYVAVCNANFERFFEPDVHGVRGNESWFTDHKKFYEELFQKGELVWSSDPRYRSDSYVGMDIRIYKISHLLPPGEQPQSPGLLRRLFGR